MVRRRRRPGSAPRKASRAPRSWPHDDLAHDLAIFQEAEGLVHLFERQLAVDDGQELPSLYERQERGEILAHPAVRPQDSELERPDEAQVLLGIKTGGGPAGEHLALPVQHLE